MCGLRPGGRHRLAIVPPPPLSSLAEQEGLGRLRDQLWVERRGCSLPQTTITMSVNTLTESPGWEKSLQPHPIMWEGLRNWILETRVSSYWFTV